jgi:carbonic anhydrase
MLPPATNLPYLVAVSSPVSAIQKINKGRFVMRNKRCLLALLMVLFLGAALLAFAEPAAAQDPIHWGYGGEAGPENWGDLSPDYALCSTGTEQSPVDIPASAPINPANIRFTYQPTALQLLNNGHTIQVNYDPGSAMAVDGKTYELKQFHFHALSEHTLADQHTDLEMHLVHQSDDGRYAVVGVMMKRGVDNAALAPVWGNLPAEEGETAVEGVTVNAIDLLPAERSYYHYAGSFTTPPCTEGVNWLVLSTPVEISEAQAAAFEQIYNNDYRPVQALNARTFLGSAETSPAALPATGQSDHAAGKLWLGFGSLLIAGGLYLYRRQTI